MGSFRHSSPNDIVSVAQEYEWIQQRHCDTSSYPCIDFPHPVCHPKNKSQKLSCKEAVTGLQKWKHWDLILGEKNYITMCKGKKQVFATSDNFSALDICIYVYVHGLCFQYTFQPKEIHSRWVQVHNKQMSSTVLVYVYGLFLSSEVALFCLIKVKIVCKWSEKFIILWLSSCF